MPAVNRMAASEWVALIASRRPGAGSNHRTNGASRETGTTCNPVDTGLGEALRISDAHIKRCHRDSPWMTAQRCRNRRWGDSGCIMASADGWEAFDTITRLITSPPAQLAVGGVLFGYVVCTRSRDRSKLAHRNVQTRYDAMAIGGTNMLTRIQPFTTIFDRCLGQLHLTVHLAHSPDRRHYVLPASVVCIVFTSRTDIGLLSVITSLLALLGLWVFPTYVSLLETRLLLLGPRRLSPMYSR